MSNALIFYIASCVISIPLLLVISAHEMKPYKGHCELTLQSIVFSVIFGMIPAGNLIVLFVFGIQCGANIVVWSNKK